MYYSLITCLLAAQLVSIAFTQPVAIQLDGETHYPSNPFGISRNALLQQLNGYPSLENRIAFNAMPSSLTDTGDSFSATDNPLVSDEETQRLPLRALFQATDRQRRRLQTIKRYMESKNAGINCGSLGQARTGLPGSDCEFAGNGAEVDAKEILRPGADTNPGR